MRAYLDTCMCVYLIERTPVFGRAVWEKLNLCHPVMCWTLLTRLECRVKPLQTGDTVLQQVYESFFARPDGLLLPLSREVFDLAAELRAHHRLKTPDALHLAAAIAGGCEEFWTNDHRLDAAAGSHLATITI
jgi:predicted nucleic acid-binding protein